MCYRCILRLVRLTLIYRRFQKVYWEIPFLVSLVLEKSGNGAVLRHVLSHTARNPCYG